jgi:hypothetical protein
LSFHYNNILNIPDRAIFNKKLTKAFFLKNFSLTAAEKKLLNNTIQSMQWLASLKASNVNIPIVKNDEYIYQEIQVFVCTLPNNQLEVNSIRCIELFQKHIPYQILVIIEDDNEFVINVCDKRINQNDKSKRTIERYFITDALSKLYKNDLSDAFYKALDFGNLDKTNLELLYKSYIQAVVQFQAASITGKYQKRTNARTQEDMEHLELIEKLERDITSLSSQIKKESQLNEKVQLNIKIKNNRDKILELKKLLNEH